MSKFIANISHRISFLHAFHSIETSTPTTTTTTTKIAMFDLWFFWFCFFFLIIIFNIESKVHKHMRKSYCQKKTIIDRSLSYSITSFFLLLNRPTNFWYNARRAMSFFWTKIWNLYTFFLVPVLIIDFFLLVAHTCQAGLKLLNS